MNPSRFQTEMNRLINVFGKMAYPKERAELIWKEVNQFSDGWFAEVVDQFIGISRHAPLLPDFVEKVLNERDRLWKIEKEKHRKEAKDFWESIYHTDEITTICQTIRARLNGQVPDADYTKFQEMLTYADKSNPRVVSMRICSQCAGSGLVIDRDESNYEWVYRCTCQAGQNQPKLYPMFHHKRIKHG